MPLPSPAQQMALTLGVVHTVLTPHSKAGHVLFPWDSVTSERCTGACHMPQTPPAVECSQRLWEVGTRSPRMTKDTRSGPRSHRSHGAGLGHARAGFLFHPGSRSGGQGWGGLAVTRGAPWVTCLLGPHRSWRHPNCPSRGMDKQAHRAVEYYPLKRMNRYGVGERSNYATWRKPASRHTLCHSADRKVWTA